MSDPRDPSGYSETDLISMGFLSTPRLAALVENTKTVRSLDVDAFDAMLVAGGQGPMFTFDRALDLQRKFAAFYEAGKVTCAMCHGVALLRYVKLSNGDCSSRERPSPASPMSKRISLITRFGQ